ncbi:MAG: hypothetical protein NVSMB49_16600 [Ktedonobacteraceae bacterium]
MQQASWSTRLGPLVSVLGALLSVISIFLPLILTGPPSDAQRSNSYPPTLDGVWLLRSLFSSQNQTFSSISPLFALLMVLTLITLGTSIPALLLHANVSRVVSWIRALAAMSSVLVLLWFLEDVQGLNFREAGPPGMFSQGFGIALLVVGTVVSALGLGLIGIGTVVGGCIGFLLSFPLLPYFAFIVDTITCLLGTLVGWWRQRATLKNVHPGTRL